MAARPRAIGGGGSPHKIGCSRTGVVAVPAYKPKQAQETELRRPRNPPSNVASCGISTTAPSGMRMIVFLVWTGETATAFTGCCLQPNWNTRKIALGPRISMLFLLAVGDWLPFVLECDPISVRETRHGRVAVVFDSAPSICRDRNRRLRIRAAEPHRLIGLLTRDCGS
jgi:hypothetical protein